MMCILQAKHFSRLDNMYLQLILQLYDGTRTMSVILN